MEQEYEFTQQLRTARMADYHENYAYSTGNGYDPVLLCHKQK